MKEVKKKHSVWLSESAWADVEHHYQADNCSTKNEYIEKAIQFYSGYLDTEHAEEYLPRVLSDVLEGKLTMTETAIRAGFTDPNYFSKVFHKIKGCSPRSYRKTRSSPLP